jgi:excisionase family DNA binding protein
MKETTSRKKKAIVFPINNDVMTVDEVAAYIRMSKSFIYQNLDKFPHRRVGESIRFYKPTIDQWLAQSAVTPILDAELDAKNEAIARKRVREVLKA